MDQQHLSFNEEEYMNEELTEIKFKKAKKKQANTLEDPAMNKPLGPGQYDP